MSQSDSNLLKKFQKILEISQEVKKSEVAKFLGLSEEDLFAKLIEWGSLGFKLNKEYIIVENLEDFNAALDEQFIEWEEKEAQGIGKVQNFDIHPNFTGEEHPNNLPYGIPNMDNITEKISNPESENQYLKRSKEEKPPFFQKNIILFIMIFLIIISAILAYLGDYTKNHELSNFGGMMFYGMIVLTCCFGSYRIQYGKKR
jgi:hypothetical protein